MKAILRLMIVLGMVILGGLAVIKFVKKCSWREALEIGDQFMEDLLG